MIITFISDTHNQHRNKKFNVDLPGGDMIIHAGDISGRGTLHEIGQFLDWFDELRLYDEKIFIAGNHDWGFEDNPKKVKELLKDYPDITYLQEDFYYIGSESYEAETDLNFKGAFFEGIVKIYGFPWQPAFNNWAFNLPRNGAELDVRIKNIPKDTDILISHGPPQGILDVSGSPYNEPNLGCEILLRELPRIKPKIHVFGHIHGSYGYKYDAMLDTHFINASVLGEQYKYNNKALTIEWDDKTNELEFI